MTVLGTAGHVDHGKSTLVRALTGTDPDTLAAERERGLTIDLGFAVAQLPSGRRVHLVDVPGHVRFLKNMLAGAGAVSGVIFVVDAVEGPMAQSREHLMLLELLGVEHGLVVITKADAVDDERLDDATLEVLEFLEGSPLADADPIAIDSLSGRGLATLRTEMDRLVDRVGTAAVTGRARLWVDRAFNAGRRHGGRRHPQRCAPGGRRPGRTGAGRPQRPHPRPAQRPCARAAGRAGQPLCPGAQRRAPRPGGSWRCGRRP